MISELERIGLKVRGTPVAASDRLLAEMLRKCGYDVSHKPAPKKVDEVDR